MFLSYCLIRTLNTFFRTKGIFLCTSFIPKRDLSLLSF